MTNVYSFIISHNAGYCARAILVGSFESVHHVNYAPNIFLISYFNQFSVAS